MYPVGDCGRNVEKPQALAICNRAQACSLFAKRAFVGRFGQVNVQGHIKFQGKSAAGRKDFGVCSVN